MQGYVGRREIPLKMDFRSVNTTDIKTKRLLLFRFEVERCKQRTVQRLFRISGILLTVTSQCFIVMAYMCSEATRQC